jgi:predicted GH43/DUF377 family glycosyl hydrolase
MEFTNASVARHIKNKIEEAKEKYFEPITEAPEPVKEIIFVPDRKFPRSTCDYRNLVYLNNKDLIEPETNMYFYNSAICNNDETTYRMFYRVGKEPKGYCDRIATCLLDSDFKVIKETNTYIDLHSNWEESMRTLTLKMMVPFKFKDGEHVEDPRAVKFNNAWFVFYTDGCTVGVGKLDLNTCKTVYSHYLSVFSIPVHAETDGREKNWIPFVAENCLYVMYSENPRIIVCFKDTGENLEVVSYKKTNSIPENCWYYGNIRGGTPPVSYDKDNLIWFFHTQQTFETHLGVKRVYMIGAYVSKNKFPFELVKHSVSPLLIGAPSIVNTRRSLQDYVVFPCGAIKIDNGWKLSMGVNDYETAFLDVYEHNFMWKTVKIYSVLNFSSTLKNE